MHEINPYQSPGALNSLGEERPDDEFGFGVWRWNELVVAHTDAVFPSRCFKSGQLQYLKQVALPLEWHPTWARVCLAIFALGILASTLAGTELILMFVFSPCVLGMIVVALISRRTRTIQFWLSEASHRQRRLQQGTGIFLLILSVAICLVIPLVMLPFVPELAKLMRIGMALSVFVIPGLWFVTRKAIQAAQIGKKYIWIKGAGPNFLASLPEWPYEFQEAPESYCQDYLGRRADFRTQKPN